MQSALVLRIARELHDIVAHHMSVVALQAGLARYVLDADPATAKVAIGTAADAGRQARRPGAGADRDRLR
ncbi:histidine kinase dimerization/phosphoacceptor domain-containing protein [Pseudonocardia sp. DSM 110487]|uniref:histidine kinase dimerization/phosphoacceptor domain-containing protein n=1 Tax=Pseudonocardia sp. DSM 110487 TaxID=2865833 RepID=UPI001C6A252D|nr:histidine kinase dimerization/phosphoacceptor domain-containing protein [Pseudonocardia sp. DSM 110487]QYN40489.1 histidine kinase dimerization/phosphoacceptor domain-containing protein [Pseudonocardia sp. DSM 110487]